MAVASGWKDRRLIVVARVGTFAPWGWYPFQAPFSCLLCVLVCSTGLHRNWLFGFTIHVPEALAEYIHSLARPSMRVSVQGVEGLIQSTARERYADVCNILLFIAHWMLPWSVAEDWAYLWVHDKSIWKQTRREERPLKNWIEILMDG